MDGLGVLLVATPLIFPLLGVLGLNPVQLGVMLCFAIEIGVVHPPVGLNLFAVSSVTGIPVGKIAVSVLPYIGVLLLMLGLVTFAPPSNLPVELAVSARLYNGSGAQQRDRRFDAPRGRREGVGTSSFVGFMKGR